MLILGIDPGTATTGYGILKLDGKGKMSVVSWGLIQTDKNGFKEKRLEKIYKSAGRLIQDYSPDVFVMEKIFFATNAKTAIDVGQAQGVLLLAASRAKIKVIEYAPATIKKTLTGNGRAKKKEIQRSIRRLLGNHIRSGAHKKTHFDDCADALACAITYALKESKGGEINGRF